MSTCCETSDRIKPARGLLTVALAGNPNSGKTTIFNALTGLRQKVANYPGVTVEKKTGRCCLDDGTWINIIDLPGTYSLVSRSPDEVVAMEVLRGLRKDTPPPDAVIVVVDASNLQRNLYLVSQLVELGAPMVIALNMMDIAERRGLRISPERLSAELGVPVIPVVAHKHSGITPLKEAILNAAIAPKPQWPLPQAMKEEVGIVGGALAILDESAPMSPPASSNLNHYHALAERMLIGDIAADIAPLHQREPVKSLLGSAANRLSSLGIDPMQADIEAHYQWIDQVAAGALIPACAAIQTLTRGATLAPIVTVGGAGGSTPSIPLQYAPATTLTERVDRILVHKVWGLVVFAAIMTALFVTIFWLAKPIMDGIQTVIVGLGHLVTKNPHFPDGPLKDLVNDGIFGGVGAVVVFVPQIALLFFFLAILEDSGYLARAAFLMDRLLSKVGLHGKSFIPLLSSFACAIPGIMATRTIENRKDRLATILVAPFMSCSARLPVYTLLIGAFFSNLGPLAQAGIMLACYALGILAAVITAVIFKRTFLKGMPSSFILEMPTYKVPQWSIVARQVWTNVSQFLKKAGTIIFALSVVLWALAYYPRLPEPRVQAIRAQTMNDYDRAIAYVKSGSAILPSQSDEALNRLPMYVQKFSFGTQAHLDPKTGEYVITPVMGVREVAEGMVTDRELSSAQSEYSFAGRFGHALAPVIRPLGYDWKMGVGLVAAFAAREVFVSTESIVYATGDVEEGGTRPLAQAMRADRHSDGSPVWSPLVAVSLLIWFVLAMQCMSTVAIVRRETGGWSWPIFMILYMNGLAYIVCFAVFQIGTLLRPP